MQKQSYDKRDYNRKLKRQIDQIRKKEKKKKEQKEESEMIKGLIDKYNKDEMDHLMKSRLYQKKLDEENKKMIEDKDKKLKNEKQRIIKEEDEIIKERIGDLVIMQRR